MTRLRKILTALLLLIPLFLLSQPQPWDPSIGGGAGGTPVGGGAPLGEGILLLIGMGIGYGIRKYRQIKMADL